MIAAKWWRKWCDYVNYQADTDDLTDDFNYEKPGVITNKQLTESNNLNKNLVEHFDYEAVSFAVWQHLSSWYLCDLKICRRLIYDQDQCLVLDLYPDEVYYKDKYY